MPESRILKSGSIAKHPSFGLINVDTASLQDALLTCRSLAEKIQKETNKKKPNNEEIKNYSAKIVKASIDAVRCADEENSKDEIGQLLKEELNGQ